MTFSRKANLAFGKIHDFFLKIIKLKIEEDYFLIQ